MNSVLRKPLIIVALSAAVLLMATTGFIILNNHAKTYPLGEELEHIGKEDYGCIWLCDSNPASVYYYATDMGPEELAEYFKTAELFRPIERETGRMRIWLIRDGKDFMLSYYQNPARLEKKNLEKTTKKYFVTLPSFNYQTARDSL